MLPHQLLPWLVDNGIMPVDDTACREVADFWSHARNVGMPTSGATAVHIPLYLWGDDAQFTQTHQDKLVAVAFGRVLETSKNALQTVWPLFLYQQAGSDMCCGSTVYISYTNMYTMLLLQTESKTLRHQLPAARILVHRIQENP